MQSRSNWDSMVLNNPSPSKFTHHFDTSCIDPYKHLLEFTAKMCNRTKTTMTRAPRKFIISTSPNTKARWNSPHMVPRSHSRPFACSPRTATKETPLRLSSAPLIQMTLKTQSSRFMSPIGTRHSLFMTLFSNKSQVQENKGVPIPETLQIHVPLTTKGDQTATHHAMAFQLMPADVKSGVSISVVAAALNNVRITDIASRRAKTQPDSIDNKLKAFVKDTELSKTTIALVDSNTMTHDTNFSHVQNESTSAHPMRLFLVAGPQNGTSHRTCIHTTGTNRIPRHRVNVRSTPHLAPQCPGTRPWPSWQRHHT